MSTLYENANLLWAIVENKKKNYYWICFALFHVRVIKMEMTASQLNIEQMKNMLMVCEWLFMVFSKWEKNMNFYSICTLTETTRTRKKYIAVLGKSSAKEHYMDLWGNEVCVFLLLQLVGLPQAYSFFTHWIP